MENSYKFFNNKECKYMPCHEGMSADSINCLFCYCPMNPYDDCLGNPSYIYKEDGRIIKNCTNCNYPHIPDNYEKILFYIKNKNKGDNRI